jgi:hypothetical protein
MRTTRQNQVDRAVAEVLSLTGGRLLPQSVLIADAARLVTPRASTAEVINSIQYHDTHQPVSHLIGVMGETEQKWRLSAEGIAWHAENS